MKSDTTEDAADVQARAFREMTGPERVLLALRWSEELRAVSLAGLRARGLGKAAARRELLRLLYGPGAPRLLRHSRRP